ncbi:uncharacterized protein BT62DRAFT_1013887 [Guyanagaster necrorhizus]|uniref:Uncharacterized protein n=1 Tax=Guyanagaster necrorhizus TaxID=856835 RepID=A0A9P7VGE2_9AGAR|nr:uncharacterized protein BT62DRAFT_1013887 [Guyanagaster necrorhizus MCA 3950]KAG7439514.1 hypothetical protein BT62DRAFT_1013887 [Guyanagaster necrorhizus MCA 3950]
MDRKIRAGYFFPTCTLKLRFYSDLEFYVRLFAGKNQEGKSSNTLKRKASSVPGNFPQSRTDISDTNGDIGEPMDVRRRRYSSFSSRRTFFEAKRRVECGGISFSNGEYCHAVQGNYFFSGPSLPDAIERYKNSSAGTSKTEGIDMPWEHKHAHENCHGVEWEDVCCSPQRLAPREAPLWRRARNGANGMLYDTPFISVTTCSIKSFIENVCLPSELGKLDKYTSIIAHLRDPSSENLSVEISFTVFISNIRTQECANSKTAVLPDIDEMEYTASALTPLIFLGRNAGMLLRHFPTAHEEKYRLRWCQTYPWTGTVWGNTHTIINSNFLWMKVKLPRTDVQLLVTYKAMKRFILSRDSAEGSQRRREAQKRLYGRGINANCVFYVMPMDQVELRCMGVGFGYDEVIFAHRGKRELVRRSGGTRASLAQADAEMREFTKGTIAELIWMEKQRFNG